MHTAEDTQGICTEVDPEKTPEVSFMPLEFYAPRSVAFMDANSDDEKTKVGPAPKRIRTPAYVVEVTDEDIVTEDCLHSEPCGNGCIVCEKEVK